jgi:hypothetical protein
MIEYILAALLAWNPLAGKRAGTSDEILAAYAEFIANVCADPLECLTVAALASEESRFAPWVLDTSCNGLRQSGNRLACDKGNAWGAWQLHQGTWTALDLSVVTPQAQAEVAVRLYRRAPYLWSTYKVAKRKAQEWLQSHTLPTLSYESEGKD